MILRRITEALRRQDWFTVAIETMIVVLGVFLGLQANNWNEARRNNALEQEYLARLHDDMTGSLEDYEDNKDWDADRLQTQALVLNSLRAGALKEEHRDKFEAGLLFFGIHNPIRRRWGAVEELKSTGNIAVLRNIELRTLIAQTEGDFDRASRLVNEALQQMQALREPTLKRYDPVEYGFTIGDPVDLRFDFEALAADQEFISLLAHIHLRSQMAVAFTEEHMGRIATLRDKLAQILEIEKEAPAR